MSITVSHSRLENVATLWPVHPFHFEFLISEVEPWVFLLNCKFQFYLKFSQGLVRLKKTIFEKYWFFVTFHSEFSQGFVRRGKNFSLQENWNKHCSLFFFDMKYHVKKKQKNKKKNVITSTMICLSLISLKRLTICHSTCLQMVNWVC